MYCELKIKVTSLAAEARLIRREERRQLRRRHPSQAPSDVQLARYKSLRDHRLGLRHSSRYALLAYACLRGVDYSRVERDAKSQPDWARLASQALRFAEEAAKRGDCYRLGKLISRTEMDAAIKGWIVEASEYFLGRNDPKKKEAA